MRILPLVIAVVLSTTSQAHARDWFVRAGSDGGDGSMQKPFADPWMALDKCEAGDSIHVTEGKYFGKNRLGTWQVPFDDVTLLGGYDKAFKTRNPWKHPSELLWDKDSKNWPKQERVLSNARNTTFDGFVLDQQDQCEYQDAEKTGRTEKSCDGPLRFSLPATVRNNVIINPGQDGVVACAGSAVENNLIINAVEWGVVIRKHAAYEKSVASVKGNTIIFAWDFRAPGKGGYKGTGVEVQAPTVVDGNILAFLDNNGVHVPMAAGDVSITNNVFFLNRWSNVKWELNAKEAVADDKSMDLLEDMGFKAYDGNEVKNPGLPLDAKWLDSVSRRSTGSDGKVDMDDWNQARKILGMPLMAKGGAKPSGVAPPYALDQALKLVNPQVKQGAHAAELAVKLSGDAAPAANRNYKSTELSALAASPTSDQAVELVVAVGGAANTSGIPGQFNKEQHAGVFLYDSKGGGQRIVGFYKKGSAAQRAMDGATGWYQGSGKPDRTFTVKGVTHVLQGLPKAGIFVESVEESAAAAPAGSTTPRPKGRDWYVRAGSSGGDGSREKPFKDPWQALEKVGSGDSVHVAEGEYNGKLKQGHWTIGATYVALLGGYDKDFNTRNPWKHPTRLNVSGDLKTYVSEYTIEGEKDHTGAIVDGFVFDRATTNKYKADGDLDYDNSIKMPAIWFAKPSCIIRNNVFLNGPEGAIRMTGGQTIENNIFFNHFRRTVTIEAGFGGLTTVRNNTFAFSWEPRFGSGKSTGGSLLNVGGRVQALIEGNIFEFADNDAIRLDADPKDVTLINNTFSHNLWSHVMKTDAWVTVDDKSWSTLSDLGWKKSEGNQVVTAGLPLDKKWFDTYLGRTAYVPGKVTMDDWNQVREILGQPLMAKGAQAANGLMPLYNWKDAMTLMPKNAKVKAGARARDLEKNP